MSSIFGSSSSATQSSTPFTGKYADWADNAYNYLKNLQGTNSAYTGQLNTGVTSGQQDAANYISGLKNNSFLTNAASGGLLNPDSNPYAKASYQAGLDDITKNYGAQRNALLSKLNAGGSLNSSGSYKLQSDLLNQNNKDMMNYRNQYYGNLYNSGLTATQNAINSSQSLGQSNLAAQSTLQGIQQEGLDRQAENYWKSKGFDQSTTNQILALLGLAKSPSTTMTQKQDGLFK